MFYNIEEYKKTISQIDVILKSKIIVLKEGDGPITARTIKKKTGTKLTMTNLIIDLANVCRDATSVLEKAHQHNLYL